MRVIAWALLFVTVCAGALIAYSLYTAELEVTMTEVRTVPADDMIDQFLILRRSVQEHALIGRNFQEEPIGAPESYEFHIYTVRLRNNGLIPADWIRLDVLPELGDVLQSEAVGVGILPAMSAGEVQLTVLARRDGGVTRRLSLTYFIWSRLYNIPIHVRQ